MTAFSARLGGRWAVAWLLVTLTAGASTVAQNEGLRPFERTKQAWQLNTWAHRPLALVPDALGRQVLFAALKEGGLRVINLPTGNRARAIASLPDSAFGGLDVIHMVQQDDHLVIALGDFFAPSAHAGLAVVDVSTASAPRVTKMWISPEPLHGTAHLVVNGNTAFLSLMEDGVMVFSLGSAGPLEPVNTYLPDIHFPRPNPNAVSHPNARGLFMDDHYLYVAFDAGGLRVLDIRHPYRPEEVGRYINAGPGDKNQAYNHLVIHGNLAYVAVDYCGLEILDISNPRQPEQVGWWNPWECESPANFWLNSPGHTNQLAFDPERQLVYMAAGDSELLVVDVSDPREPVLRTSAGEPGNGLGAWSLALADDTVYLGYIQTVIPFRGTWSGVKAYGMGW